MKRIYPLLLSLFYITAAFGAEQEDPFKPQGKLEWHLESIKAKPYLLEVAYGETERALSVDQHELNIEVDPDFLGSSAILSIAVSPNETGEVKDKGRYAVKYRVSENPDGSFNLRIYIKTLEGGLRETNTELTLNQSDWLVVGGITRSVNDGTSQSYITAIRMTPRAKHTGDDNSE